MSTAKAWREIEREYLDAMKREFFVGSREHGEVLVRIAAICAGQARAEEAAEPLKISVGQATTYKASEYQSKVKIVDIDGGLKAVVCRTCGKNA